MEDFDVSKCRPETYMSILENIGYYEGLGNKDALNVFRSLKEQMEKKCALHPIIRSLDGAYNSVKPEEKKCTMIGLERYIITENPNGTKSLSIPEPEPKPKTLKSPYSQEELNFESRNQNRTTKKEVTEK